MSLLNSDEAKKELSSFEGWAAETNQIVKEFKFKDFKEALNFIKNVAEDAEEMNHHPDILLHSYNKVKLTLSTHSEGAITDKDITLAKKIEGHSS